MRPSMSVGTENTPNEDTSSLFFAHKQRPFFSDHVSNDHPDDL